MTVTRRAVLGGGAGLGIVALGGIGLSRFLRSSAPDADVHAVLFDLDQPVLGNPQGDVTVAEFFDYQCPFCKRGHDDLMAEVEAVKAAAPIFQRKTGVFNASRKPANHHSKRHSGLHRHPGAAGKKSACPGAPKAATARSPGPPSTASRDRRGDHGKMPRSLYEVFSRSRPMA